MVVKLSYEGIYIELVLLFFFAQKYRWFQICKI
jgi:hypothetical protein